jgi:hypothetical protein
MCQKAKYYCHTCKKKPKSSKYTVCTNRWYSPAGQLQRCPLWKVIVVEEEKCKRCHNKEDELWEGEEGSVNEYDDSDDDKTLVGDS